MAKKVKDKYIVERKVAAAKLMKDDSYKIEASSGNYRLSTVEAHTSGFIARLISGDGLRVPGMGMTKEESVVNALIHLESLGSVISDYMTIIKPKKKKKKGLQLE